MKTKPIVDGLRMELPNGLSCIVSLESSGFTNADHDELMESMSSLIRQAASKVKLTPSQTISVNISINPSTPATRLPMF